MEGLVIKVKSRNGKDIINYISKNPNHDNNQNSHRVRRKQMLFGEIFTTYSKDMSFKGYDILIDKRLSNG